MDRASLYLDDVVTWADMQVGELRRLALTAPSNGVDWQNVIEEIESVGRSEWQGIQSRLVNALVHVLKGVCDPGSLSVIAWAGETDRFLLEARTGYRSSMRGRVDLAKAWRDALRLATSSLERYHVGVPPRIPRLCPFTLERMLAEDFTYEAGVAKLTRLITSPPTQEPTP